MDDDFRAIEKKTLNNRKKRNIHYMQNIEGVKWCEAFVSLKKKISFVLTSRTFEGVFFLVNLSRLNFEFSFHKLSKALGLLVKIPILHLNRIV